MIEKKLEQMYCAIKAIGAVALEAHGGVSEETQRLEFALEMLTDIMTPYNATLEQIKALRELTGDGMTRCHKAIVVARGDQELAVSLMQRGSV